MKNLANKTTQHPRRAPIFIGLDMANTKDSSVVHILKNDGYQNDRAICSMVSAITELAILSQQLIHIEVKFTAVVNELEVKVFRATTNYLGGVRRLFVRCVYLDNSNALDELKALEDQLIELVAEAKDKAIGAC